MVAKLIKEVWLMEQDHDHDHPRDDNEIIV
jgi:hypothetical protein